MDVVLYTDASPPRPVNSRLDCNYGPGNQRCLGCAGKSRGFMHFQPQPMPQAVTESFPVPLSVNVASRERVGSHSAHSCPYRVRSNVVRVAHDLVYLSLLRRWRAEYECPRNIRAVTAVLRAEVEKKKVALL